MVANFFRVRESTDIHELVFSLVAVREATRSFAELAERFRRAPSRSRTPSVLKHDVNTVFAVQAGELLCQCWRRGMFSVYRPHFYLPDESEPRIRYAISWFTFIRWHLAPTYEKRFRADWQSEFATFVDQLRGQKDGSPPDFSAAVSDDAKESAVWRLDLCADVQATACAILAEELEQLLETVERRLEELPEDGEVETQSNKKIGDKNSDPNRKEGNRLTFWAAIRDGHFDAEGNCIRDTPYANKELTALGMTGNPSEMFRLHLASLVRIDDSKPRALYEWFCKNRLKPDPDKIYEYVLQQLGEKPTAYREKQASPHTLDGEDATWKGRQEEADKKLDSETSA